MCVVVFVFGMLSLKRHVKRRFYFPLVIFPLPLFFVCSYGEIFLTILLNTPNISERGICLYLISRSEWQIRADGVSENVIGAEIKNHRIDRGTYDFFHLNLLFRFCCFIRISSSHPVYK